MTSLTLKHFALICDIERKCQEFHAYSSSKQRQISDLYSHGLVRLDEDGVRLTEKVQAFINHIEHHANMFLKDLPQDTNHG